MQFVKLCFVLVAALLEPCTSGNADGAHGRNHTGSVQRLSSTLQRVRAQRRAAVALLAETAYKGGGHRGAVLEHRGGPVPGPGGVPTKYRLGESIKEVRHTKVKGGKYEKGSPLYKRQQDVEEGLRVTSGEEEAEGRSCMWLCGVLLVSCLSLSVAGGSSQLGGREYRGGKRGLQVAAVLSTVSTVLTLGVLIYITLWTNILRHFVSGHEVGLWCAIACVWAIIQVIATLIVIGLLVCFVTAGAVMVSSLQQQHAAQSSSSL